MKLKPFCLVFVVLLATPALATTVIDTYPSWDGNVTVGWLATAQTFTAPADNVLLNYKFAVAPRSGNGNVNFSIYNWGGGPVGVPLYSAVLPWTTVGGDVLVSGINLALTTGNLYGADIDLLGYSGASVHFTGNNPYGGGGGWWWDGSSWFNYTFDGLDHKFRAEFEGRPVVPEPATLLLLGSSLAGLAAWRRKSKR